MYMCEIVCKFYLFGRRKFLLQEINTVQGILEHFLLLGRHERWHVGHNIHLLLKLSHALKHGEVIPGGNESLVLRRSLDHGGIHAVGRRICKLPGHITRHSHHCHYPHDKCHHPSKYMIVPSSLPVVTVTVVLACIPVILCNSIHGQKIVMMNKQNK